MCKSYVLLQLYIGRVCSDSLIRLTINQFQLQCRSFDVLLKTFGYYSVDFVGRWGGVAGGGGEVVRVVSCCDFILRKFVVQLLIGFSFGLSCLICWVILLGINASA